MKGRRVPDREIPDSATMSEDNNSDTASDNTSDTEVDASHFVGVMDEDGENSVTLEENSSTWSDTLPEYPTRRPISVTVEAKKRKEDWDNLSPEEQLEIKKKLNLPVTSESEIDLSAVTTEENSLAKKEKHASMSEDDDFSKEKELVKENAQKVYNEDIKNTGEEKKEEKHVVEMDESHTKKLTEEEQNEIMEKIRKQKMEKYEEERKVREEARRKEMERIAERFNRTTDLIKKYGDDEKTRKRDRETAYLGVNNTYPRKTELKIAIAGFEQPIIISRYYRFVYFNNQYVLVEIEEPVIENPVTQGTVGIPELYTSIRTPIFRDIRDNERFKNNEELKRLIYDNDKLMVPSLSLNRNIMQSQMTRPNLFPPVVGTSPIPPFGRYVQTHPTPVTQPIQRTRPLQAIQPENPSLYERLLQPRQPRQSVQTTRVRIEDRPKNKPKKEIEVINLESDDEDNRREKKVEKPVRKFVTKKIILTPEVIEEMMRSIPETILGCKRKYSKSSVTPILESVMLFYGLLDRIERVFGIRFTYVYRGESIKLKDGDNEIELPIFSLDGYKVIGDPIGIIIDKERVEEFARKREEIAEMLIEMFRNVGTSSKSTGKFSNLVRLVSEYYTGFSIYKNSPDLDTIGVLISFANSPEPRSEVYREGREKYEKLLESQL